MQFEKESELITRLKNGDQKAVEVWYKASQARLKGFFASKVKSEHDVDELVHDTYLSCLKSLPLFRAQSGLWSWMVSIARHELADYWRRYYAKRVIRALPFGDELLHLTIDEEPSASSFTQEILSKLPEDIVELLHLKYVDKLSVKQLAMAYGISFEAMQSRLYRAKMMFWSAYEQKEKK